MTISKDTSTAEAARTYKAAGWRPIPLKPGTKSPCITDWKSCEVADGAIDETFANANVGVVLGPESGGLIDVDIDAVEALPFAEAILKTGPVFGRAGKPKSHYLLRQTSGDPVTRDTYIDPIDNGLIAELRGKDHQTMMPPSVHPSGERVEWSSTGQAKSTDPATLRKAVGMVAVGATIVRHYADWRNRHHELFMALAGGMLAGGYTPERVEGLVRLICIAAGDADPGDRIRVVRDTATRVEADEAVASWRSLANIVGFKTSRGFQSWLGIESASEYRMNDTGNGERLVDTHGDRIRYCPALGWLVYDGSRWATDDIGRIYELAKDTARAIYAEAAKAKSDDDGKALSKWAGQSLNNNRLTGMVEAAKTDERVVVSIDDLDKQPWLFNVANGTVNLRTGGIDAPNPRDLITQVSPVRYDWKATAPTFDAFLRRVLPDPPVRGFVQRSVGYFLTGTAKTKAILLLHGGTDTGKTTLVEILQALFGSQYAAVVAESTIATKRGSDGVPNDIARLRGTRLVTVSETNEGAQLNVARLKAMSGRTRQVARFMRKEFFEFEPTFKILIDTNHRPHIKDSDDAIWNRVKLVEFGVVIPAAEQIEGFADLLASEMPGVLNWAIAGCLEWQRIGLAEPEIVKAATRNYRDDMNPVSDFFTERCLFDAAATATHADLFGAYVRWAEANNVRYPLGKRTFTAHVADIDGVISAKGTGNVAVFRGVSVVPVAKPVPITDDFNPFERPNRTASM